MRDSSIKESDAASTVRGGTWLRASVTGAISTLLVPIVLLPLIAVCALVALLCLKPDSRLMRYADSIMSDVSSVYGRTWQTIVHGPADTQPSHVLAGNSSPPLPMSSSLVSVDPNSSLDPHYRAFLTQALRKKGLHVTDDPAQADLVLNVTLDVAPPQSASVGSTAIWRATADATLRASARNGARQVFSGTSGGEGRGMQPDSAKDAAAEAALDRALEGYIIATTK